MLVDRLSVNGSARFSNVLRVRDVAGLSEKSKCKSESKKPGIIVISDTILKTGSEVVDLVSIVSKSSPHRAEAIFVFHLTNNTHTTKKESDEKTADIFDRETMHKAHEEQPHCLGQLIEIGTDVNHTAERIANLVMGYYSQLDLWPIICEKFEHGNLPLFDFQSRGLLPVVDFLDRFEPAIAERSKQATTRWLPEEDFLNDEAQLKCGDWVVFTCGKKFERLFGIGCVHRIERFKFKDVVSNDGFAAIENMSSGMELYQVLQDIYPALQNDDHLVVWYFTCVHYCFSPSYH